MPSAIVSLHTQNGPITDIQIWNDAATATPDFGASLEFVSAINHRKIPLFLVSCGPLDVYTETGETETFFFNTLACSSLNTGVLAKQTSEDSVLYVVFYLERKPSLRVRCYCVDFSMLQSINEFRHKASEYGDENVYFSSKLRTGATKSDTSVFDRVLEHKTARKATIVAAPQPQVSGSQALTTSHQISQAVNRVVLSGLRLRGLSTNASTPMKDKIAIKEIYHMTNKAALFASRKYSYDFNTRQAGGSANAEHFQITLKEIQNIVESLLSTFVDVEPPNLLGEG